MLTSNINKSLQSNNLNSKRISKKMENSDWKSVYSKNNMTKSSIANNQQSQRDIKSNRLSVKTDF